MMLDAASSADMAATAGLSMSIPSSATGLAAITVAAASSEAATRPPLSVGLDVTATVISTAADVDNDARYDRAANVDGGPCPAALGDDADDGGAGGNTSVQVAIVSVILNAAKSSLRAYFEGVNWPLNKALPKGPSS
jgi:hypothetical protein